MRKGFTLIELLAVIVILAIISLITTPILLDVIEKAKVGSAKASATGYIEAVEMYIGTMALTNNNNLIPNEKYNVTTVTVINSEAVEALNDLVETKGSKPSGKEDYIKLNDTYEVVEGKLTFGEYEVNIQNEEMTVIKLGAVKLENIILNLSDETMEKGSTIEIVTTFEPNNATNKDLIYKSSDESIVTVNEKGIITAIKNGTATITVTSAENKNIKQEINITVITEATGITIEKENKELFIGNIIQLTGILEPNDVSSKSVTWTSSNNEIASVSDSGLVTGKKVGTVTITATTKNNKQATIEIEVKEVLAESISIIGIDELYVGNTLQLDATILPDNTTNKSVTWTSSNSEIASVSNSGLVTGKKAGTVTITATTKNNKQATLIINTVYANGTAIYYNPETNKKCNESEVVSTTGTKTGCMKWYTFNDDKSSSTVNLILDHNTTTAISWASNRTFTEQKVNLVQYLGSDTATWNSSLKARFIEADEIAKITGTENFDSKTTTSNFSIKLNIGSNNQTITTQGASKYAWLLDYTRDCTSYGCNIADSSTYGYWTLTPIAGSSDAAAWSVKNGTMGIINSAIPTPVGIRPVITISKSI